MKAVIWTMALCNYCYLAKDLMETKGVEYEERNIDGGDWSRQDLKEALPDVKTLPQIFIDGQHVGGYNELYTVLKENNVR